MVYHKVPDGAGPAETSPEFSPARTRCWVRHRIQAFLEDSGLPSRKTVSAGLQGNRPDLSVFRPTLETMGTPQESRCLLIGNSIPGSASSQQPREPRRPSTPTDLAPRQAKTKPIPRPPIYPPQFTTNSLRNALGTPKRPREKRSQRTPSTFPRRTQRFRPLEKLNLNFTLPSQDEPNPAESNSRATCPQSHNIVEIGRPKPSSRRATACSNRRFFRQGKPLPSGNAGIRWRTPRC
jgi:hypothetical protein